MNSSMCYGLWADRYDVDEGPSHSFRRERASILIDSLVGIFVAVGFATVSISGFAMVFESVALHQSQAQLYDYSNIYQASFTGSQQLPTQGYGFFNTLNANGQASYCDFSDPGCPSSDFATGNGTRMAFVVMDYYPQTDPGATYNSFLSNVYKFNNNPNLPNSGVLCNTSCSRIALSSNGSYYGMP